MRRNDFTSGPSRLVPMRQPRITGAEIRAETAVEVSGPKGLRQKLAPRPDGNPAAVDRHVLKQEEA